MVFANGNRILRIILLLSTILIYTCSNETDEKIIQIDHYLDGNLTMRYKVQGQKDWSNCIVSGFNYEMGNFYTLKVKEIEPPPSSFAIFYTEFELIDVVSKIPADSGISFQIDLKAPYRVWFENKNDAYSFLDCSISDCIRIDFETPILQSDLVRYLADTSITKITGEFRRSSDNSKYILQGLKLYSGTYH